MTYSGCAVAPVSDRVAACNLSAAPRDWGARIGASSSTDLRGMALNKALTWLWMFIVVAALALAMLMNGLFKLGIDARVDTIAARVDQATGLLQTRFASYEKSFDTPPDLSDPQRRRELSLILQLVLQDFEDVEGGFFASTGFLAYAFPSYEGSGNKQDVPEAESALITKLSQDVIEADAKRVSRIAGERQVLIIEGAPLRVGDRRLAVWVMSRAHVRADDASRRLLVGLGVLGLFVVGSGASFAYLLRRWNHGLRTLGNQLEHASVEQAMTPLSTGQTDLDRVGGMVTALHERLRAERQALTVLESELSRARRVASLGRMTAQLVHEVRNPIAAMRLRAENALAGASDRDAALRHVLTEIHRLDDLLERMQAVTRLNVLRVESVDLTTWLKSSVAAVRERAEQRGITIRTTAADGSWPFDAGQLARALGNLMLNGIAHADALVAVDLVTETGRVCRITVADDGAGIDAAIRDHLFDPFFTTRADGTGLGLSIAREIVEAHGGTLTAVAATPSNPLKGAVFMIELPWRAS